MLQLTKKALTVALLCVCSLRLPSTFRTPKPDKFQVLEAAANRIKGGSLAFRNRNAGNLTDFRTGKKRKFDTFELGLIALRKQIEMYQSGASLWTDSTTDLSQFADVYEPNNKRYLNKLCSILRADKHARINQIDTDSLMWAVIQLEDGAVSLIFKQHKIY